MDKFCNNISLVDCVEKIKNNQFIHISNTEP